MDARRHADDHSGFREEATAVHLLDEVAKHLLGDVEVGDDAVLQRTDGLDVGRGAPDHPLRLGSDGEDRAGEGVDGDDGGLVQDDPASANIDERVRGTQVDCHIATQEPRDPLGTCSLGRRETLMNPLGHGLGLFLQGVLGTGNLTLARPNGSSPVVTALAPRRSHHGTRRALPGDRRAAQR
jgi:hypothetical protein